MSPAEITLPGVTSSVPAARRFVERTLDGWGLGELAWTATLLVSELAANACLHARTPMTIALTRTSTGGVRLDVHDGSLAVPRMRQYAEESTTGRGLRLVEDLSRSWGVEPTATGKFIWAELVSERLGGGQPATAAADSDIDLDVLLSMFPDETDGSGVTSRTDRSAVAQVLAVVA